MTEHVSTAHIAFHSTWEIVHKADHKLQAEHHWMNCNEETRVCNFTEDTCTESSRNIAFSTQWTPCFASFRDRTRLYMSKIRKQLETIESISRAPGLDMHNCFGSGDNILFGTLK